MDAYGIMVVPKSGTKGENTTPLPLQIEERKSKDLSVSFKGQILLQMSPRLEHRTKAIQAYQSSAPSNKGEHGLWACCHDLGFRLSTRSAAPSRSVTARPPLLAVSSVIDSQTTIEVPSRNIPEPTQFQCSIRSAETSGDSSNALVK